LFVSTGTAEIAVRCSFLELYNEEFKDLLEPPAVAKSKNIMIREELTEGGGQEIVVNGARSEGVKTFDDVAHWIDIGCSHRTVAATKMNEGSSRSHAIFTLTIEQQRAVAPSEHSMEGEVDTEYIVSKFFFVDLAGSERVKKSGAVGQRFKESIGINKSLLALGNVISALGDDKKRAVTTHVPYRDSKLTRLLKDSLGGNSRTLMIACASPADSNFEETLSTLNYANRARNIQNKAVVNRDGKSSEVLHLRARIEALELEIANSGGPQKGGNIGDGVTEAMKDLEDERDALLETVEDMRGSLKKLGEEKRKATAERDAYRRTLEDSGIEIDIGGLQQQQGIMETFQVQIEKLEDQLEAQKHANEALQMLLDESAVDLSTNESLDEDHEEETIAEQQRAFEARSNEASGAIDEITEKIESQEQLFKAVGKGQYEQSKVDEFKKELTMTKEELKMKQEQLEQLQQEVKNLETMKDQLDIKNKKMKDAKILEEEVLRLNQKCRNQEKKLKYRSTQEQKITTMKEDINKMKLDKVEMVKKKRDEEKRFREWKVQQMDQLKTLNRDRQKLSKKMVELKQADTQKNSQLEKRERIIADTKAKLKKAEQQLMNAAKGLVRQSRGSGGTKDSRKEQKIINQQVEAHMAQVRYMKQIEKYEYEMIELKKKMDKCKLKIGKFNSSIPGVGGSANGLREEHIHQLESYETEYNYKKRELGVLNSRTAAAATPGGFENMDELTVAEAKAVCQRVFANLIEAKDDKIEMMKQLKTIEAESEARAKENLQMRKRVHKQRAEDQVAIDGAEQREKKSGTLLRTEQSRIEELSQEVKNLRDKNETYTNEIDDQRAAVELIKSKLEIVEKARLESDRERKSAQARLKMYTEGDNASSGEAARLASAEEETTRAWKQIEELEKKNADEQERAEEAEEDCEYQKKRADAAQMDLDKYLAKIDDLQTMNIKLTKKLEFEKKRSEHERKRSLGGGSGMETETTEVA